MRLLEYILKFGFMFLLSITLVLFIAPALWNTAGQTPIDDKDKISIQNISINEAFNSDKYLALEVTSDQGVCSKNFYVDDREHIDLIKFLKNKGLISGIDLKDQLPISISKQQLEESKIDGFVTAENNVIENLILDDQYVLGSSGELKTIALYCLGVIFGLLGIAGTILTAMVFFQNFKEYKATGKFPELPNSIDSKVEGVKFIFRGFKQKK